MKLCFSFLYYLWLLFLFFWEWWWHLNQCRSVNIVLYPCISHIQFLYVDLIFKCTSLWTQKNLFWRIFHSGACLHHGHYIFRCTLLVRAVGLKFLKLSCPIFFFYFPIFFGQQMNLLAISMMKYYRSPKCFFPNISSKRSQWMVVLFILQIHSTMYWTLHCS